MHDELEEDAQERLAAGSVQVEVGQVLLVSEYLLGLVHQTLVGSLLGEAHLLRGVVVLVGLLEYGQQVSEPIVQAHVEDELNLRSRRLIFNSIRIASRKKEHSNAQNLGNQGLIV